MNANPVALKEWASVIRVLAEGGQILVLRKGGIAEETRRFELKSQAFYLYPTYEHQRPHLVKPAYQAGVEKSLAEFVPDAPTVELTVYAEAVHDLEVHSLEQLEKLYPYHMWSEGLAAERLRWKAKEPLHVLLLRVYELEQPVQVEILPEYSGCRSWIELVPPPPAVNRRPVLSDEAFAGICGQIKAALVE